MNEFDALNQKAQSLLETYKQKKAQKIIKEKLKYSRKIESHIPTTYNIIQNKIADKSIQMNYGLNAYKDINQAIDFALQRHVLEFIDLSNNPIDMQYIYRQIDKRIHIFFFFGNEEYAFNKVLEKMASKVKWLPQIIEGKICGEINDAIIMQVFFDYDQSYAKYLKNLYDAGKFLIRS